MVTGADMLKMRYRNTERLLNGGELFIENDDLVMIVKYSLTRG